MGEVSCVMISCCTGAELQVRKGDAGVVLRELYPTRSDLYERANALREQYKRTGVATG